MTHRRTLFMALLTFLILITFQYPVADAATTEWSKEIPQQSTTDLNKPWTIKFSQNIDEKSVGPDNIKVTDTSDRPIDVKVRVSGNEIIVTPTSPYSIGVYDLYVGPGIKSVDQQVQKANIKFTFTVKDAVNPFMADVQLVEERYGYVELVLRNTTSHKVMYELVERNQSQDIAELGEVVPTTATEYKEGEQFLMYMDHQVHIYLVDSNDRIVDSRKETSRITPLYEFEDSTLTVTAAFKPWMDVKKNPSLYIVTEDFGQLFTDLSKDRWSVVEGLHTIKLEMQQPIEGPYISISYYPTTGFNMVGGEPHSDKALLNNLFFAYKLPTTERTRESAVDWSLWQVTCGGYVEPTTDERCFDPNIELYKTDSLSMKTYEKEFLANEGVLTTRHEAKQLIESVNARLKDQIDAYKSASKLVDSLYRDNPYEYLPAERMREGVTMDDVVNVRAAVETVSDGFDEKVKMLERVELIEWLLEEREDE